MQRFIGAMSYHRRHIPHFAEVAAPLTKLFRKDVPYVLKDHELRAINYLKAKLIEAPALELPDLNGHFIVTTDASDTAVGGCLSQPGTDGQPERVIAYCSRMLSPSERNGSSCAKELNAILYGIGHFYFYLANKHFTLRTDSRGLIYLRSFTKPNAKLHTASAILDELSFDIEHQSATSKNLMGIADMISRAYGTDEHSKERTTYRDLKNPVYENITPPSNLPGYLISRDKFNELVDPYLAKFRQQYAAELGEGDQKPASADKIETGQKGVGGESTPLNEVEHINFVAARDDAPKLDAHLFQRTQHRDAAIKQLLDNPRAPWVVHNRILYRKRDTPTGRRTVLVVPAVLRLLVLEHYHGITKGPHFGRKKLYATLQQYFWWPKMSTTIAQYCRDCVRCKFETPKTGPKAQFQRRYRALRPNDVINIDIVGPYPMSTRGMKYVLTMQCDFSKFVCVVPLPDKTSAHVARALTERWLFVFGTPRFVRSDEGTDTDAAIVQYVCKMKGIQKIRTPVYSPHANPVERFHRTMNQALRTWIGETQNKDWDIILPNIVLAYYNFIHSTTKYSPS